MRQRLTSVLDRSIVNYLVYERVRTIQRSEDGHYLFIFSTIIIHRMFIYNCVTLDIPNEFHATDDVTKNKRRKTQWRWVLVKEHELMEKCNCDKCDRWSIERTIIPSAWTMKNVRFHWAGLIQFRINKNWENYQYFLIIFVTKRFFLHSRKHIFLSYHIDIRCHGYKICVRHFGKPLPSEGSKETFKITAYGGPARRRCFSALSRASDFIEHVYFRFWIRPNGRRSSEVTNRGLPTTDFEFSNEGGRELASRRYIDLKQPLHYRQEECNSIFDYF